MVVSFSKKMSISALVVCLALPARPARAIDLSTLNCENIALASVGVALFSGSLALILSLRKSLVEDKKRAQEEERLHREKFENALLHADDPEEALCTLIEEMGFDSQVAQNIVRHDRKLAREIYFTGGRPLNVYVGFALGADPRNWARRLTAHVEEKYAREEMRGKGLILLKAQVPWGWAGHYLDDSEYSPYYNDELSEKQRRLESKAWFLEERLPLMPLFVSQTLYVE